LDADKALGFAKMIVRDMHFQDRAPEGDLHVGDTIDAIVLPWQGKAIFKAINESVIQNNASPSPGTLA
jgi:hypothetical protein